MLTPAGGPSLGGTIGWSDRQQTVPSPTVDLPATRVVRDNRVGDPARDRRSRRRRGDGRCQALDLILTIPRDHTTARTSSGPSFLYPTSDGRTSLRVSTLITWSALEPGPVEHVPGGHLPRGVVTRSHSTGAEQRSHRLTSISPAADDRLSTEVNDRSWTPAIWARWA